MQSSVPVIELAPWLGGEQKARAEVAAEVDAALQSVGFFLIAGHGVLGELRERVRAEARAFFALPPETKQRYAVTLGGRGWLPPGVEANGYAEGTATPADLKELAPPRYRPGGRHRRRPGPAGRHLRRRGHRQPPVPPAPEGPRQGGQPAMTAASVVTPDGSHARPYSQGPACCP